MPAQTLRFLLVCFTLAVVLASDLLAQIPGEIRLTKGQKLRFQVDHQTEVTDTQGETKTTVKNLVQVTKVLEVAEVDPASKTFQIALKLEKLKMETVRPNGQVLAFDSEDPKSKDSPLGKSLSPLVGKDTARLKVDQLGRVLEVQSEQMPAGRYEVEPVFLLVLPGRALKVGDNWQRAYNATLDPPAGTGEKVAMIQTYTVDGMEGGKARIRLSTAWKEEPKTVNDQMPLLQYLPEGMVVIDPATGLPLEANLKVEKEIKESTGANSSYRFQSVYKEKRLD
ncbi:MAG: hypothetical protein ACKOS8_02605 [Gemmataceae bacterium]